MPDLDARLPSSLQAISETRRLGADVPSLVVRPESAPLGGGDRIPFLLWMHGRTATKELDPGRYLRLARAGIGVCAIDLPGHGERGTLEDQEPERILDHIERAIDEIDEILRSLGGLGFDLDRAAIGGMSMGGMVAIARLCRPHRFRAAVLEATEGTVESILETPTPQHPPAEFETLRRPRVAAFPWEERSWTSHHDVVSAEPA